MKGDALVPRPATRRFARLVMGFLMGTAAAPLAAVESRVTRSQLPDYRGTNTTGKCPARGLLKSWPTTGPELLFEIEVTVCPGAERL